jgi:hypothetical protein
MPTRLCVQFRPAFNSRRLPGGSGERWWPWCGEQAERGFRRDRDALRREPDGQLPHRPTLLPREARQAMRRLRRAAMARPRSRPAAPPSFLAFPATRHPHPLVERGRGRRRDRCAGESRLKEVGAEQHGSNTISSSPTPGRTRPREIPSRTLRGDPAREALRGTVMGRAIEPRKRRNRLRRWARSPQKATASRPPCASLGLGAEDAVITLGTSPLALSTETGRAAGGGSP